MFDETSKYSFQIVDASRWSPSERVFAEGFSSRVIGQPGALQCALMAYNAAKNPLRDKRRPIGIYYLVGPSRTGKSLTAEVLAEIFHGSPDALIRIQASDFEEKHQILQIKGSPPSYVGYRDPGDAQSRLTDDEIDPYSIVSTHNLRRVRSGSKSKVNIVVIEEFEKSCYDFYKLWMGVFDKGVLQLGNGVVVDFTNTIFILTSNLATDELERMTNASLGFQQGRKELTEQDVRSTVERAMARHYKREFRNRLDAVVVFKPLTSVDVSRIVDSELAMVNRRILAQMLPADQFLVDADSGCKSFLLQLCAGEIAELKRVIARELLMPLGRLLASDSRQVFGGDFVLVSHDGKSPTLTFSIARSAGQQALSQAGEQSERSPIWTPQSDDIEDRDPVPPRRPGVFLQERLDDYLL